MLIFDPFKCLDFLMQVKNVNRTWIQIILWWELRRILYNVIVGVVGFCCLMALWQLVPQRGSEDVPEPIAIAAFGYLCNICYCLGWFAEIFISTSPKSRKDDSLFYSEKHYGPFVFKLGLGFTLLVMFLPVLLWCLIDLFTYLKMVVT